MALTRKLLKGMGLNEEQVDTIIDAHAETVDGLKDQIDKLKDGGKNAADLEKRLKDAEEELENAKKDGWKEKHDRVKKELDDLKAAQTAKETRAAKEKAVRAFYEKANITDDALTVAMRGSHAEIEAAELDENGNIKDTSPFDALVKGDFAKLVSTTVTTGVKTATPPATTPGAVKTKEEILKIKDTAERQKAWGELIKSQKGE